jgi:hypothetical protein
VVVVGETINVFPVAPVFQLIAPPVHPAAVSVTAEPAQTEFALVVIVGAVPPDPTVIVLDAVPAQIPVPQVAV